MATDLLTRNEVLALLKCSRSSLYVFMETRNFPRPLKLGASNRWIKAEVEAWVDDQASNRPAVHAAVVPSR